MDEEQDIVMDEEENIDYPLEKDNYKSLRQRWKPGERDKYNKVDVLIVAEAPPNASDNRDERKSYFYNHETGVGHRNKLFSRVTRGIYSKEELPNCTGQEDKIKRLKKLRKDGFWLMDIFQKPKEDIDEENEDLIEKHVEEFRTELREQVNNLSEINKIITVFPQNKLKHPWRNLLISFIFEEIQEDLNIDKISKWEDEEFDSVL